MTRTVLSEDNVYDGNIRVCKQNIKSECSLADDMTEYAKHMSMLGQQERQIETLNENISNCSDVNLIKTYEANIANLRAEQAVVRASASKYMAYINGYEGVL